VERILEAAARVFAVEGYDAATVEAIAAGAETSVGSIYQFFPNKLAIFHALAAAYHARLRTFFDQMLDPALLARPWDEILDAAVDAFAAFHAEEIAFRAIWAGLHLTAEVVHEGEAINRDFARRIEAVLEMKLLGLPAARRPVVATMMVEIMSAMLIVSARRPAEAAALLAESKDVLQRYLAPFEEGSREKGSREEGSREETRTAQGGGKPTRAGVRSRR